MAVTMLLAALALLTWPVVPTSVHALDRRERAAMASVTGRDTRHASAIRRLRAGIFRSALIGGRGVLVAVALGGAGVGVAVSWPCGVAVAVAAATTTRLVLRARGAARARADLVAATAGLRALARELRSGAAPSEAVERIESSTPPRVAQMMRGLVSGSARPAASGDLPDEIWERLRAAGTLSAAHGIPLSAVVESLAADLADRMRIAEATAAQVAGPAVSGYLLAALPAAGLLLGAGMGTDPIAVLTGSAIGGGLLVVGTLLCCAGLLWADRIVRG